MKRMLRESPAAERDALLRTAALTQLAFLRADRQAQQAMPARLRARLLGMAAAQGSPTRPR